MYSDAGDTTSLVPGFPIRKSSDPRSVDSSPRHIAASHVLHRLPVPRHPPCALKHLQHEFSTNQFWKNCTSTHITTPAQTGAAMRARCSQPLSTNQTPHPTTKRGDNSHNGVLPQSPIVCLMIPAPASPPTTMFVVHQNRPHYRARPIQRIAQLTELPQAWAGHESRGAP